MPCCNLHLSNQIQVFLFSFSVFFFCFYSSFYWPLKASKRKLKQKQVQIEGRDTDFSLFCCQKITVTTGIKYYKNILSKKGKQPIKKKKNTHTHLKLLQNTTEVFSPLPFPFPTLPSSPTSSHPPVSSLAILPKSPPGQGPLLPSFPASRRVQDLSFPRPLSLLGVHDNNAFATFILDSVLMEFLHTSLELAGSEAMGSVISFQL